MVDFPNEPYADARIVAYVKELEHRVEFLRSQLAEARAALEEIKSGQLMHRDSIRRAKEVLVEIGGNDESSLADGDTEKRSRQRLHPLSTEVWMAKNKADNNIDVTPPPEPTEAMVPADAMWYCPETGELHEEQCCPRSVMYVRAVRSLPNSDAESIASGDPFSPLDSCPDCQGDGMVSRFEGNMPCERCGGTGRVSPGCRGAELADWVAALAEDTRNGRGHLREAEHDLATAIGVVRLDHGDSPQTDRLREGLKHVRDMIAEVQAFRASGEAGFNDLEKYG